MVKQHKSIIHYDILYAEIQEPNRNSQIIVSYDNEECLDGVSGESGLPTIQKGFARVNSCDRSQTVMLPT